MEFQIDDVKFDPTKDKIPFGLKRIMDFLDALPDGKLLRSLSVSNSMNISKHSFSDYASHPALNDYKEWNIGSKREYLYGNKSTISEYRDMIRGR